jgi:hypothetical protein
VIMSVVIWWTEINACKDSRNQECQTHTTSSQMRDTEPVGLGITKQPTKEGKIEIGYHEKMRCWLSQVVRKVHFGDTVERWTNSAVAILRAELDMDAEKGLLLSVQESERSKGEKDQTWSQG